MSEPILEPGTLVGGKYRIERLLGEGGMGVVVAAVHMELDQQVALKFLHVKALSGTAAFERFLREARAVARLKSEHIARVHDLGRDDFGNPFMVLELLEGQDLARVLETRGALPVVEAVDYVLQACSALVEAHAAGIIHRDLKPHNLFLGRRPNGAPLVKVLDFGIAKDTTASAQLALTESQAVVGSPFYMAPEHMRSARSADERSDIWSLGVILFELLSGRVPFEGDTLTELCIRVVSEPPAALASLAPTLDPALVAVVMRCLEKEPEDRFQTVAELANALAPFARGASDRGAPGPGLTTSAVEVGEPAQATRAPPPLAQIAPRLSASSPGATGDTTGPKPLVSTDTAWGAEPKALRERAARGHSWRWVAVAVVASVAVGVPTFILSARTHAPGDPPLPPAALGSNAPAPAAPGAAEASEAATEPEEKAAGEVRPEPAADPEEQPDAGVAISVDALPETKQRAPVARPAAPVRAPVAPPERAAAAPSAGAPATARAEAPPPPTSRPARTAPVANEAPILDP